MELALIASTICKTNRAHPRRAARPGTLHQAIDGKRQRRRAPLPKFCQNCSAARRSFEKPNGTRHGPRRRPCRVRVGSVSRGRTAAASLQNRCYSLFVTFAVSRPSPGLQRVVHGTYLHTSYFTVGGAVCCMSMYNLQRLQDTLLPSVCSDLGQTVVNPSLCP